MWFIFYFWQKYITIIMIAVFLLLILMTYNGYIIPHGHHFIPKFQWWMINDDES